MMKSVDRSSEKNSLYDDLLHCSAETKTWISTAITAVANFSVQYNYQAIAIVLLIMSSSTCTTDDIDCNEGHQAEWVHSVSSASVFAGSIAGQLVMGYAGDVVGRNAAMCLTLMIACFGAVGSAVFSYGSPDAVYGIIIVCRLVLGIGLGGVYPLSAVKAFENSSDHNPVSGAIAFSWQVPGGMTPWLLALICSYSAMTTDETWRFILGFGAFPAFIVVLLSLFEMRADGEELVSPEVRLKNEKAVNAAFNNPVFMHKLLLTGGTWFLYDVALYGMVLFGGHIIDDMKDADDDNVSSNASIEYVCIRQLIALACGIPAMAITIYLLSMKGVKFIQIGGFSFASTMFVVMAVVYYPLKTTDPTGLFVVYCVLLFSLLGGAGVSTFLLPAETYPHDIKATFNGVSAACGKMGAVVGAFLFGPLAEATTYPTIMVICAICSAFAALFSYIYIRDPGIKEDDRLLYNSEDQFSVVSLELKSKTKQDYENVATPASDI